MLRRYVGTAALLVGVLSAGCGSTSPPTIVEAEGIVLLDGAPLSKARVRFVPRIDQSSAYIAQGVTDEKGRFTLTCHGQTGACAGDNLVTVTEDDIPERLTPETARLELQAYLRTLKNRPIPTTYSNLATSPLTVIVTAGEKEYKIALTR